MQRIWILLVCASIGCADDDGTDASTVDAGADTASGCTESSECDDGAFCNGVESCVAGECAAGTSPCEMGCDETADRCVSCSVNPDMDGDGVDSPECGGNDCDDSDPNVFPGNTEVCDGDDEDCDPSTFGARDMDGDGFDDAVCCNGDVCGSDCNDMQASVFAGATEVCNGRDDDCDGTSDEGVLITFFRDRDSDTYGDDDTTVMECSLPTGFAARGGDCIDDPTEEPLANQFNPGESEVCDEADNDCDMSIDEDVTCDCTLGVDTTRACGFDPDLDGIGNCRLGNQMCVAPGMWTSCAGAIPPVDEVCNGDDDDCDGSSDEGVRVTCWEDIDRDGFAASDAPSAVQCPPCADGNTDTDPAVSADCDDTDENVFPGAPEVCNRLDDDCSRGGGVQLEEDRDDDGFTAIGFAGCEGGFPKTDCHDQNALVNPSSNAFRHPGYCPPGDCLCGDGRCFDPGPFSTCTPCATGTTAASYDYNCNGTQEREPDVDPGHCACSIGACPSGGANYAGSPACGATVSVINCVGGPSCPCSDSTSSGNLRCR